MNRIEKTKYVARLIVGFSTGYVVANVIKNNTTPDTQLKTAEVMVAGTVLGSMVANLAEKHVDAMIDSAVSLWKTQTSDTKS